MEGFFQSSTWSFSWDFVGGLYFFLLLLRFFFGSFFYFFSPATEKMGRKNRRGSSRRPSINGRVSLEVAFLPRRFNVLGSTIRPQIARCKNPVKLGNTRSLLTKTDPTNTIQETCQKKYKQPSCTPRLRFRRNLQEFRGTPQKRWERVQRQGKNGERKKERKEGSWE